MPPEWAIYVRRRTRHARLSRCRELFGWTKEEYLAAPARFVDWALAFDRAEQTGRANRAKAEAERLARQRRG